MDFDNGKQRRLVQRLRRALPLSAYPRPALLAFLKTHRAMGGCAPRLIVTDVFDAGGAGGLMCRFAIADVDTSSFVAPLDQLALDRRRPVAREAAAHRRQTSRAGAA
jgi:hypothetical protein